MIRQIEYTVQHATADVFAVYKPFSWHVTEPMKHIGARFKHWKK